MSPSIRSLAGEHEMATGFGSGNVMQVTQTTPLPCYEITIE
jgi:hypothetical protein